MQLEDIGFYTLSDQRALNSSVTSPLWRCELILTDACNFKCPYCRGLKPNQQGTLNPADAMLTLAYWTKEGLKNIRFSGGEPTLYPELAQLVYYCKFRGVERIAISTNGSASQKIYDNLLINGANDFSISLDGACCSVGDRMAGNIEGAFDKVVKTIQYLSTRTYVTVGMVFTNENIKYAIEAVQFAESLGVSDIRVIPSAQYNKALAVLSGLPQSILNKFPILKYRIENIKKGRHVRGIHPTNRDKCLLALDDMAVVKNMHYPCIIHMREGGQPIGTVGPTMREDRADWVEAHQPWHDSICSKNCLDVCVDYNHKANRRYKQ